MPVGKKEIDNMEKIIQKRKICIQKFRNKLAQTTQKHRKIQKETILAAPAPAPTPIDKNKRCPKGTRRNKKTGECEKVDV
jgi:hypothetical protein